MNIKMSFALAVTLIAGCDDKDSSGTKISTTRVRPLVQENLPASILSSGTFTLASGETDYSKTCQTDASAGDPCMTLETSARLRCIVKNRLFCAGPTEVLNLLDSLDGRLEEIELRSSGVTVTCLTAEAVDLSEQLVFPGELMVTSKFQCQDSTIGLGFGKVDDVWYVREAQGAAGHNFAVNADSDVHGHIWLPSKEGNMASSTGMLEIVASKKEKTVEITGGGVGFGFCGLHFKSNADFVYLNINPDGVGSSCDFDQNATTDSSDWVEACYDAETLDEAPAGSCDSLKEFELTTLGRDVTAGTGAITSFDAVAPRATGELVKVELNTYLNELFESASTFEGVSEFTSTTPTP